MNLETRYANHPDDASLYDSEEQRRHFIVEGVFRPGSLRLTYTHVDRMIFGGAVPTTAPLTLEGGKELGTEHFLDRRELGLINTGGGRGRVLVDGKAWELGPGDGLYVGKGAASVSLESLDPAKPARLYLASSPAHETHPTVLITAAMANPRRLGSPESCNLRTINQYVHPAVCKSCQLVMGLTVLEPGSVWNTWPPHTHERRMEVYVYFNMAPETRVFHFHGRPDETRHLVLKDGDAVISPSWSIHSGVGTGPYTFIWAMAGENQTFDDMDSVAPDGLR